MFIDKFQENPYFANPENKSSLKQTGLGIKKLSKINIVSIRI